MCSTPIGEEHSHVVNVASRNILCVCRPCYLLFTREGAAQGKYRAVPDRYISDPSFLLTEDQWDRLQIPVRMAFFFFNSALGRHVAFYPGPAGATESLLKLEAWDELVAANPLIQHLQADVEALLVSGRREGSFDIFLVPINACYELVGRVTMHWKGFDGGQKAWEEIDRLFAEVRSRSEQIAFGAPS
jgi:hypothetical protein